MSFHDCLTKWISNKSDFHIHVLNQLPCVHSFIYVWSPTKMCSRSRKVWSSEVKNAVSKILGQKCGNHLVYFP